MSSTGKPDSYGRWWNESNTGPAWYRQLFEQRRLAHEHFMAWTKGKTLVDVLEVGCGCSIHYPQFFSASNYVGMDISKKEINWSRANNPRDWHSYVMADAMEINLIPNSFDLVFAHAVIDHVSSAEALLEACVIASRGWVYLTAYRGWFPDLPEHEYTWDDITTCFYNNLSAPRLRESLEKMGCTNIEVMPFIVHNSAIETETTIIAKVPS